MHLFPAQFRLRAIVMISGKCTEIITGSLLHWKTVFFQSPISQRILNFCPKVMEKSGQFWSFREKIGKYIKNKKYIKVVFWGVVSITSEGAPWQVGTKLVKLAGLSSKSTCNLVLHLEFRVHIWLVHSCVQFAVPADWEALWVWVPLSSPRKIAEILD